MYLIEEILPDDPLEAEVVLHLRLHLRRSVRSRSSSAARDLALYFGFAPNDGEAPEWTSAAEAGHPFQAGAEIAARRRGLGGKLIPLGHDAAHIERCRIWLLERKKSNEAFSRIVATDLATLLELSKARDLAVAKSTDQDGRERYLPILIQGPSGTGKELLAEAIHRTWKQATGQLGPDDAKFQVVHVAGMTPELINDELFGHVRGAFTDAKSDRRGLIEAAHGGTLFIDEVGDLPPEAQLRLLRVLQTHRLSRFGENEEREVQIRIVAATWHDIEEDVREGRFRLDLYHRLRSGSMLMLPRLVERRQVFQDVVPELIASQGHHAHPPFTRSFRDALTIHSWDGNLRELVHVLRESIALADGETLRVEHLPSHIQRAYLAKPLHERAPGFLEDSTEWEQRTPEVLAWRIAQVQESLDHEAAPPASAQLIHLHNLVNLLDDGSPEHVQSMAHIRGILAADQARSRHERAHAVWSEIANANLSLDTRGTVDDVLQRTTQDLRQAKRALARKQRKADLPAQNSWLQLFQELTRVPLLSRLDRNELARLYVGSFNLIKLLAPDLLPWIRDQIHEGGLTRLRAAIAEHLSQTGVEDENPEDQLLGVSEESTSKKRPGQLTRDEWQHIAQSHSALAVAAKSTGFDRKTIKKYLEIHRIENPWVPVARSISGNSSSEYDVEKESRKEK